ncbi:class I SAM-dependent methyltransferase [Amycolatopsis regifaucium]|uniref:Methyltransferase type 12 n=1 Tax=Amycolatopsis regifaucium TaxID=546365 RepID=A0A154MT25_9PSEU|nr:methyltransferase domain-containing protein [Amycolatopsis regifaucium]KZB87412.1 methyltransferase type 12 [Amycolatopsis regifaucium]OKA08247.1 SAM-dependent methyltransferase [Amycolatopsis regifaucium]SFI45019.1 Methyltransferase domain-containing protein [Amycolatopsis regifaucium]
MTAFDIGLLGHRCWLELATGERVELPVERWTAVPGDGDDVLLDACSGPTLDIGCGPGRLTAALTGRGIAALGVDISATAVRLTHARGAVALRRDVFDRVPGEGRWRHVLLADGNIGIGGDPLRLLSRTAELVADGGTVLVELDPPGRGVRQDRVRLRPDDGAWFTWAWVGVEAIAELAARTAFRVTWATRRGHRWFACLEKS